MSLLVLYLKTSASQMHTLAAFTTPHLHTSKSPHLHFNPSPQSFTQSCVKPFHHISHLTIAGMGSTQVKSNWQLYRFHHCLVELFGMFQTIRQEFYKAITYIQFRLISHHGYVMKIGLTVLVIICLSINQTICTLHVLLEPPK